MRTTADQLSGVLDHWRSGTGPLYQQLADAIVALAEAGSLEHGARMPSERALATRLHLSRNTVTAAYQRLRDQGWLDASPGSAPRLGTRSRGVSALTAQDRFSRILVGQQEPLVALNTASPPPAPVVAEALARPEAFLGGLAAIGNGYAALGDRDLTLAITDHLRASGVPARPDEVVVTAGAQQALWLALTALAGPNTPVALEGVTYPGVFDAIAAAGSRPFALPMTERGLDVDGAVKMLRAALPDVAYVTTFNNPTGTALAEEQAVRLLEAAAASETTVIDDRTIGELALDGRRRRPFASLGTRASVVTIGGMSKVFWGGLRIGWLHTNATLAAQLRHRRAAMDLGSPAMFQRMGAVLLREHFDAALAWRLDSLRESLAATEAAIGEAGLDWEHVRPAGGPSLWVRMPGVSAERFAERAERAGVPVVAGAAFCVVPGQGSDRFRLPFYLPPEQMRLGIKTLAERAA
ncbi:PLP-dependent aminotransferase family protein [Demequina sp. SYSU T00039]|uniref:PLP-dependent aminotransferase family protein n=1 Tax=Demequina lignilytica TaxID=3051663 RepID=A0AAW7M6Y5_9MICO|nr:MULTISPECIES: PLP-dependent aminotransferase family protein [unclassified Demequina]MDN4478224.1 PLP-dependent aminotransferase family protein [Demequina sp. SYSU T00039-1]MDN4488326.1 PLP-dependent aminotransferase family protein [Demequina sp. SYSU T00039]MDN4490127.1 PLP-dependent aminotransferase family protein [Demequina sp. SYSU T00068]